MIALLDVNVLIALVVKDHPFHEAATQFFRERLVEGWATCPLTENALLRIVGGSAIPGHSCTVNEARDLLGKYVAMPGHHFWPDDISFTDKKLFPQLPSSKQLTDLYLVGLAVKHAGRLATFDQRIDPTLVTGGSAALYPIPR